MPHPKIDRMAIVVPVVHQLVELQVEIGVLHLVCEVQRFDLRLDALQFVDVGTWSTMPTNQRVSAGSISTSISQMSRTNSSSIGPDAGAAVRRHEDEAFAAQLLQSLPHRIGGRAHAACELGHLQALVRLDTPMDDVVAQPLVDGGDAVVREVSRSGAGCRMLAIVLIKTFLYALSP